MSEERDNALAIAEMRGDRATVRAEMEAMESRIDASLAQLREDIAKRDKENTRWQIGLWIAAIIVLGVLIRWPG